MQQCRSSDLLPEEDHSRYQRSRRLSLSLTSSKGSASLRILPPQPDEQDIYAAPVQRPSQWRHQRTAEEGSGLLTKGARDRILIKQNICSVCEVGIGPDHYATELYLWYARCEARIDREFPDIDTKGRRHYEKYTVYFPLAAHSAGADETDGQWHKICGGCAARFHVPDSFRVVDTGDWEPYRYQRTALALRIERCQVALQTATLYFTYQKRCQQQQQDPLSLYAFVCSLPESMTQGPLAKALLARQQVKNRKHLDATRGTSSLQEGIHEEEEEEERLAAARTPPGHSSHLSQKVMQGMQMLRSPLSSPGGAIGVAAAYY